MMCRYGPVAAVLVLAIITFHQADGLRCYQCSSLLQSECSLDWDLSSSEAQNFEVECSPAATACQKIIGELQGNGAHHVFRNCWNKTITEESTPMGCEEDEIRGSVNCRCSSDLCNGQRPLRISGVFFCVLLFAGNVLQQLNLIRSYEV